jgi:hypothetical protein
MIKYFSIIIVLLSSYVGVFGQQGARVGLVTSANLISMVNADDAAASDNVLKQLPTFGMQNGLDVAYHWRFVGIGSQFLFSQNGQKYTFYGQRAETKLNYFKPTLLIHFNTNPKNDVRLSGYLGGAYGILRNYAEISQITNPVTKAITYSTYQNKNFSIIDTGNLNGTISEGIYYPSDASVVGALGLDFRMNTRWLMGIHFRIDLGMEKLENYNKVKLKYSIDNVPYSFDYEHWKNRASKFDEQNLYTAVRKPSTNLSYGAMISIKYLILNDAVREYERYGY